MENYKNRVKKLLSTYVSILRTKRKLTQEAMAEQLHISSRAYGDLERGKYCFSAVTLLLFLLMLSHDELDAFLTDFRTIIRDVDQQNVA